MPVIIVDDYDHPSINSHKTKGFVVLKDGASIPFDSLSFNTDIGLYILFYDDQDRHNVAILPEKIQVIKYD